MDNNKILGDHTLVKSLAVATKLALCHAKSAAHSSGYGSTTRVDASIFSAKTQKIRALAEIALWRAAELQDILLVFSAEHMVAQTERLVASAPPKLAGVTPLHNALEVSARVFALLRAHLNRLFFAWVKLMMFVGDGRTS